MANKTVIPALRAHVGDWTYYVCIMKYAEVDKYIKFAYELGGNTDLSRLVQRGLTARTKDITDYLLTSKQRFLGSMLVATWGGEPQYTPLTVLNDDEALEGVDEGLGRLTFEGDAQHFALDGQHRLQGIKDAIRKRPELGDEDISVILVKGGYKTEAQRARVRRLFTHINRNAVSTSQAENIALDVDDGYAVTLRRLLTEHDWLSKDGVVRVFTRPPSEGEVKLAGNQVPQRDPRAFTTIVTLYNLLLELGWDLDPSMDTENVAEPTDAVLDAAYKVLESRLDDLLGACGDLRTKLEKATDAAEIRAPKGKEGQGHAFMRPVVQRAVASVASELVQQGRTWAEVLKQLRTLSWRISDPPWLAVYNVEGNKMITGKDFTDLLFDLLYVHLAPESKKQIKEARTDFRELRGTNYPVSAKALEARVPSR